MICIPNKNSAIRGTMRPFSDFVVVGGGILGLTIAREIKARYPSSTITVFEKERALGLHASGRNSGVIHAGLYYEPASLKAQLSVEGAQRMREFCYDHKLPILERGKLVLPLSPDDGVRLNSLFDRAQANGVKVEIVDQNQISELEPTARSLTGLAIHSPKTSVMDPKAVMLKLYELLKSDGVKMCFGSGVLSVNPFEKYVELKHERHSYGFLINCAGAFSDRIARSCQLKSDYCSIPFKGIYFDVTGLDPIPRKLLYPLPDLRAPFLGVHFTTSVSGELSLGPNAIPALGRENYQGLRGVDWRGLTANVLRLSGLYLKDSNGFRALVHRELSCLFRRVLAAEAQKLIPGFKSSMIGKVIKVGIRPQIFNLKENRLEMDFIVERTANEIHILNSISPGFTCALSFADYVVDRMAISGQEDRESKQKLA